MKRNLLILAALLQIGCESIEPKTMSSTEVHLEKDSSRQDKTLTVIVEGNGKVDSVFLEAFLDRDCTVPVIDALLTDHNPVPVHQRMAVFTGVTFKRQSSHGAQLFLKVSSENSTSACSNAEGSIVLHTVAKQPDRPIGLFPVGYFSEPRPVFKWEGDARTANYHFVLTVTETDQLVFEDVAVVGTQLLLPDSVALEFGTKYTWKVQSIFSDGSSSAFSEVWDIMLYDPGFIPAPKYPAAYIPVSRPAFNWNPVVGAAQYEVELIERDSGNQVWNLRGVEGTGATLPEGISLDMDKVYHWRVRAFDSEGGSSLWSDWLSFLYYDDGFAPELLAPTGSITSVRPTFSWSEMPNARSYEIEVREINGPLVYQASADKPSLTLVPGFQFRSGISYAWRVRTVNTLIEVSAWSQEVEINVK